MKDEGCTASADEVITLLHSQLAKVQGVNLFLQDGRPGCQHRRSAVTYPVHSDRLQSG